MDCLKYTRSTHKALDSILGTKKNFSIIYKSFCVLHSPNQTLTFESSVKQYASPRDGLREYKVHTSILGKAAETEPRVNRYGDQCFGGSR